MTHSAEAQQTHYDGRRASWMTHAALVCVSIVAGWPLLSNRDVPAGAAWDRAFVQYELSRLAIRRDRQWPLWNPYVDGGTPLLAQPDNPASSPWFVLTLLLGTPLGMRAQAVLFMALGATGMAALLRFWNVDRAGRFVGGVIYGLNSQFVLHVAVGEIHWCATALMPWVMLGLLRGRDDLRWIVGGGMLLASGLTLGAFAARGVSLPFFVCWSACESIRRKSIQPSAACLGMLIVAGSLSAAKLLPESEFLKTKQPAPIDAGIAVRELVDACLDPRQIDLIERPNRPAGSAYVTWLGLALAGVGLLASAKQTWPLVLTGLAALWVSLGNACPIDLWAGLRRLPGCDVMGTPARFSAGMVFVLAVLAGHGLSWCVRRLRTRKSKVPGIALLWGVAVAIAAELLVQSWTALDVCAAATAESNATVHTSFATRYDAPLTAELRLAPIVASNSGILISAAARKRIRVAGRPDYRGEVSMRSGNRSIEFLKWSMSEQRIYVDARLDDRLYLNQNEAPGWSSVVYNAEGGRYESATNDPSGLVSVQLHPGDHEIVLRYLPDSFVWGVCTSVAAFLCCIVFVLTITYRRRAHGEPDASASGLRSTSRD